MFYKKLRSILNYQLCIASVLIQVIYLYFMQLDQILIKFTWFITLNRTTVSSNFIQRSSDLVITLSCQFNAQQIISSPSIKADKRFASFLCVMLKQLQLSVFSLNSLRNFHRGFGDIWFSIYFRELAFLLSNQFSEFNVHLQLFEDSPMQRPFQAGQTLIVPSPIFARVSANSNLHVQASFTNKVLI